MPQRNIQRCTPPSHTNHSTTKQRTMSIQRNVPTLLLLLLFGLILSNHTVSSRDCSIRWRRSWRDLTCTQQNDFLHAITLLKQSGTTYDDFRTVHYTYRRLIHRTDEFLPWHRWFIHNFETALQNVTGSCIYIPYWDSERDATQEDQSPVFHSETFGSYNGVVHNDDESPTCTMDGIVNTETTLFRSSATLRRDDDNNDDDDDRFDDDDDRFDDDGATLSSTGSCLQRDFVQDIEFSGESEILAYIISYTQYQDTTGEEDVSETNGFRMVIEGHPHSGVHTFLGGHMATNNSPDDPLFYLHHANIDRLWSLWQDYHDHDVITDVSTMSPPDHYGGDLFDEPMPYEVDDVQWDFRITTSEGDRVYPSPRDVISNDSPQLRVKYVNDHLSSLLPDYEPNPKWFHVATDDVPLRCNRPISPSHRQRQLNNEIETSHSSSNDDNDDNVVVSTRRSNVRGGGGGGGGTNTNLQPPAEKDDDGSSMISPTTSTTQHQQRHLQQVDIATGDGHYNGTMITTTTIMSSQQNTTWSSSSSLSPACNTMKNRFTRQIDQVRWEHLCVVLNPNTSVTERFEQMAVMDCSERTSKTIRGRSSSSSTHRRPNNRSWTTTIDDDNYDDNNKNNDNANTSMIPSNFLWGESADSKVMKWIHGMGKSNDMVAFECFHRPDNGVK